MKTILALGALALLLAASGAGAEACPPGLPPGVTCGVKDASLAVAGTYKLDPSHAAILARVSHIGYSLSVFRFGAAEGTLTWDPAAPTKSTLSVSVETASIATPVPGFAEELAWPGFLKAAANPKATFVSTAFRPVDATHGQVDGQFTLNGKTRPLTFDVELLGAGKGFGKARIGIEARAAIAPADFGLTPMLGQSIGLLIDAEFERAG